MNDSTLALIAKNILTGFLLSLGIIPSEGEDTLEIREYGPHQVFEQQAKVPENISTSIDARETYQKLIAYIDHHNALPTATRFYPYNAEVYRCPCGCGTFLYVSIYHNA